MQFLIREFGAEVRDVIQDPERSQEWLRNFHDALIYRISGISPFADRILGEAQAFCNSQKEKADARWQKMREKYGIPGSEESEPEKAEQATVVEMNPPRPAVSRVSRPPVDPVLRDTFEVFRKAYAGQKNGLESELQVFLKACVKFGYDPAAEVVRLLPAWDRENKARLSASLDGSFFPQVKNLKTWLGNACWLQDLPAADPVKNLTQGERLVLKRHLKESANADA